MTKRTGARTKDTVDSDVLRQLNDGVLQAATLSEALAVDFSCLLSNVCPGIGEVATRQIKNAEAMGITKRMELAARLLSQHLGGKAFDVLSRHPSDSVRGWAAFNVAFDTCLSLEGKLEKVRQLADDSHFGVREWSWLALRPAISEDISLSMALLLPWADDDSENIRRFSIESTRPRGVWSKHIQELKDAPQLGAPLLDKVMDDPSRYVQNSCANWLNDAAKHDSKWVFEFCEKWRRRNDSDAVTYVTRRALRNVA